MRPDRPANGEHRTILGALRRPVWRAPAGGMDRRRTDASPGTANSLGQR
jgi:hypothetical protein